MRIERFDNVTLYEGDCLEILPTIEAGSVDAVVTDPPYGIGFNYESHDDSEELWYPLINAVLPECRRIARFVTMPACSHRRLGWWYANHSPTWIICWYKFSTGHRSAIGFNDWESILCWGRPAKSMHDYFAVHPLNELRQEPEWLKGHPCRKPEKWAAWLCERAAGIGDTVLDPFLGAGTTGAACVKTGRKFIGIEKEEKYFDIACRRIEKALSEQPLFKEAV